MSIIAVQLADSSATFPNFPHACTDIKEMAEQMGITRNIRLMSGKSLSVQHISQPSALATLLIPPNFPENSFNGASVPKAFILRHELAHVLYHDDSVSRQRSLCLSLSAGIITLSVIVPVWYASRCLGFERLTEAAAPCLALIVSNFLYVQMQGGRTAYQFRERRADQEACKYLSVEEKIAAMAWLKSTSKVVDGPYYSADAPDPHPSTQERIRTIWETFTEQQKIRHEELKREYSL
jgi:hypothetical protein